MNQTCIFVVLGFKDFDSFSSVGKIVHYHLAQPTLVGGTAYVDSFKYFRVKANDQTLQHDLDRLITFVMLLLAKALLPRSTTKLFCYC